MLTLATAVEHLYQTAVTASARTSTTRLSALAEYCIQQLEVRGLSGLDREVVIPGGGRPKQWDVALRYDHKYRLAISLKSILRNLPGTVPNRLDDLMGEVTNIQMYSPEIVVGYLMVFDVSQDVVSSKHGMSWCQLLTERLRSISGRAAPSWSIGTIEAFAVIRVDFSQGPVVLSPEAEIQTCFDRLAQAVVERNPGIGRGGSGHG